MNLPRAVRVTILATTDLHGQLMPGDADIGQRDRGSLAQLATLIEAARLENPMSLLLDGGDTIQGTALCACHQREPDTAPEPMMHAMNAMRYDAMVVGNHDFDFGRAALERARIEANFPWLSANICREGALDPCFGSWIVKTLAGIRVGVLGLTTPAVPTWIAPQERAGLEFLDSTATAKRWVRHLREVEQVDLVVVVAHLGLEADPVTRQPRAGQVAGENAALAIAREVEGIDILLAGHTHETLAPLRIGRALLMQAGKAGECLARIDVDFDRSDGQRWVLHSLKGQLVTVQPDTVIDPVIARLAAPYQQKATIWQNRVIGLAETGMSATDAHREDSALLELVQCAQLEAGNADVSLTASFNPEAQIGPGDVTVRDIARLYPYDNTLVVVELTGQLLKDALEHAAELLDRSGTDFPIHEFDVAEGVEYEIDPTRVRGDRVVQLRRAGQALLPDERLRAAITSYRWGGGGGYSMFAAAPVLARSTASIRDLIIGWVERHRVIPGQPNDNWRFRTIPPPAGLGQPPHV